MQLTKEEGAYLLKQLKKKNETPKVMSEKAKIALGLVGL